MGKARLIAAAAAISALVLAVALELFANAVYYYRHGSFFYAASRAAPAKEQPYTAAEAVFHPYYAFIHRVGRSGGWWTTNNLGFQVLTSYVQADPGCCDIPLARKEGELIVGVFGGSVAGGFSLAVQKSPAFGELLARIPGWEGRRVRILNFGMPGFKQPQQLNALAYALTLGQHFDLVLNIDGFNEIVTSHRNWTSGAEPSFPSDELWGAWGRQVERLGSPTHPDAAARHLAAYYGIAARDWRARADSCVFAACFLASRLVADLAGRRGAKLDAGVRVGEDKRSLFPTAARSPLPADAGTIHRNTAAQWAAASRAMAAQAHDAGSLYLHVIQPNQWWKAAAGDYEPLARDHIYKWVIPLVESGYPELVARVPELAGAGVAMLDATAVFRGRAARDVYVDDCCHYTDAGNALLGEAIAARVREVAASRPR